nr:hypothetical protein [Cupriavidus lacunae]
MLPEGDLLRTVFHRRCSIALQANWKNADFAASTAWATSRFAASIASFFVSARSFSKCFFAA